MKTPKQGDSRLSASYLKEVTELARQTKYTSINAPYERNGNTGMSITLDKQQRQFISHPWQVNFFDYKFANTGDPPEIENVKLTMSEGQFFGGDIKTYMQFGQFTDFVAGAGAGKQTPVEWHKPSFDAAGVGLELIAMPGSRIMGHTESNIYGQYGFAEDSTNADDAENVNTGLVAGVNVDDVDQPRAMIFPKSKFGKTYYLLCTYHNDELVTTIPKDKPIIRLEETVNEENLTQYARVEVQGYPLGFQTALNNWYTATNHQFGVVDGGEGLLKVVIMQPDLESGMSYPVEYPIPTHVSVGGGFGMNIITFKLVGQWNYLIAKIHIDANGRPFIRQRLRSDIFHYPQTLYPATMPTGNVSIRVEKPTPPTE